MLKKTLLAICCCLLWSVALAAQEAQKSTEDARGGIVIGKDHAFTISAPKGWVLDNASGSASGLAVVLYPEGAAGLKGPVFMYANTVSKNQDKKVTLKSVIESDIKDFKVDSPNLKVTDAASLKTHTDKNEAVVKYFSGTSADRYEAVAYIEESTVVVMLVMSARTQKEFEASLPAFKELVQSYFFITGAVVIEEKK